MKEITVIVFLFCFSFGIAQNKNSEFHCSPLLSEKREIDKTTTNSLQISSFCSGSHAPPVTINGIYITEMHTGYVTLYPYSYLFVCSGPTSIAPNSIWLGDGGPFTYTLNFSQPVNNLTIALTACGGSANENFIFVTNMGIPTINTSVSCDATIVGNEIISGAAAPQPDGGGGIFTIVAPNNFTSMVISGDGGDGGSILSICPNSVQSDCNSGTIAPILNTISSCGVSTINLNTINSNNLPASNGVSLVWFTGTPATSSNQLTSIQAASQPINTTYYAAFYDNINNCYSPTSSFYPISTIPITPTFTLPNEICFGDIPPSFPLISNEGIYGSWSPPDVNNMNTTNYTFTPNNNQCATSMIFNLAVNKRPNITIDSGCNGKDYLLIAISDIISNVTYNWYDSNNILLSNGSSLILTNSGTYKLKVTNLNCDGAASIDVLSVYCDIQKGISPNNDGLNDFFELRNLNVNNLSIFNRYGIKIYNKADYKNEWGGNANNGTELPDGIYYYFIEFKNGENKTGWIYLNRSYK